MSSPQRIPSNREYRPPAGREKAPQRPPRPSQVPAMFDPSQIPSQSPIRAYRPQNIDPSLSPQNWEQESFYSQPITTPRTPQSRASTTSSVGSIPDFPIAAMPTLSVPPPRRSANLGPPPSARRGVSSYYSQQSFVSPIPEESPRTTISRSRGSYASSAAIPLSWAPGSPGSPGYYSGDNGLSDSETVGEESRNSGGEGEEEEEERGLVRKASLGRRQRPSIVTTRRSVEAANPERRSGLVAGPRARDTLPSNQATMAAFGMTEMGTPRAPDPGFVFGDLRRSPAAATALSPDQRDSVWPMHDEALSPHTDSDASTLPRRRTSPIESPTFREPLSPYPDSIPVDPETPIDARMSRMLEAHQAAAASGRIAPPSPSLFPFPSSSSLPSPSPSRERGSRTLSARLSAIRRPSRLDMDKVRDTEAGEAAARGSMTSLPDLIRRATRLASLIDRGRRPASRFSPGEFFGVGVGVPDGSAGRSEDSIGMVGTNTTGGTGESGDGESFSYLFAFLWSRVTVA